MKVNRKIQAELVQNLRDQLAEHHAGIQSYIDKIELADTVEKVMEVKWDLLYSWVIDTPITDRHCYFCIELRYKGAKACYNCEYGKIHGICGEKGSDWMGMSLAKNELLGEIEKYYQLGEKY